MKNKLIKFISLSAIMFDTYSSQALQTSQTCSPGTYTNVLSLTPNSGSIRVSQIIVNALTVTNVSGYFVDAPTNWLAYTNLAYTNTISYATNYVNLWTNSYGVVNGTTNLALIDNTNNVVPASTNLYPSRVGVGCLGGSVAVFQGVNYYFENGIWFTNTGSGTEQITIIYQQ
jgi:hypothetical protein